MRWRGGCRAHWAMSARALTIRLCRACSRGRTIRAPRCSKGGACRRCCCREIMPTSAAGGSSSRWPAPPSAGPTCSPRRGPRARRGAHWMSSKPAPVVMLAQGPQVRPEEKIEVTDHEQHNSGNREAAHDPRDPGLQAGRHRGRAGEGGGGRPRARPGVRGRRDRAQQPRTQLLVHGAQDLSRRGRRARLPDLQPGDQRDLRQAPRQRAPRQALLSARSVRQGCEDRGKDLTPSGRRQPRLPRAKGIEMTPRSFFSGLWRGLDGLRKVLHLLVLLAMVAVLVGVLRAGVPRIPARAALLIAPQGELVEQLSGDPVTRAVEQARGEGHAETLLWDLTDSIHAAASDRRIPAVALDLEKFAGATQVTLEELASALREFRASGKKVIAYGTEFTQERYYLAAQADEIYLDPMGFVLLDGYDRYRTYLKDALDKLGVDINVFRVGAFKSAVETYTRTSMSPEDREESRSYLNALWSSYQQAVTRARKLPADALTKYVATLAKTVPAAGGDAPQVALQAGLITGIRSRLEVERRLIELAGQDDSSGSFKSVPAAEYVRYARA